MLLIGGIAVSLLLSLLVYVLGTGRARALVMVHEKTVEITHQALHDALTGLPNRVLVLDRAEQMLARARRDPGIVTAALYVDVDRFKYVNDSFGHAAGDTLLTVVAARLQSVMRDQDTVGRMGGDEFVVLLESSRLDSPPQAIAERVNDVLRAPVELADGRNVTPRVSIGIAIGSRASAEQLLQDADLALYSAKGAGKDQAVLFQASMQREAAVRLQLELDLSRAVDLQQFFLVYQPILALETGQILGVEALIRWQHPDRGVVQPEDFIPLAEESGRILQIGRWALRAACRQAAAWEAKGHDIGMSVNVSALQLDREDFADHVRLALRESGIDPSALTLEITETALMHDPEAAAERLNVVKAIGVHLAIDDFGTGSSSLAYLRQFDADSIKIDQGFIAAMTRLRRIGRDRPHADRAGPAARHRDRRRGHREHLASSPCCATSTATRARASCSPAPWTPSAWRPTWPPTRGRAGTPSPDRSPRRRARLARASRVLAVSAPQPLHLRPTAELAERVLLPGDPGRALLLAQILLEQPLMFNHHRGLWGYTGEASDGGLLTIQATGMGGPSAAIVLTELIALGARRAIRVGTCGAIAPGLELGRLIVAREAIGADGTSRALGAPERVCADGGLTTALERAAPTLSREPSSRSTCSTRGGRWAAGTRPWPSRWRLRPCSQSGQPTRSPWAAS